MSRPRVVLLRGHSVNPWELGPWQLLTDRYDVVVAVTGSNRHDVRAIGLPVVHARARRDRLPRGRVGDLATLAVGDRYVRLGDVLVDADIVHTAELGVWWAGQPAALRSQLGFRVLSTVWETIPFRGTYRGFRGRDDRLRALGGIDLFLAATERARRCLLVEGVPADRIVVSPPGVAADRFAVPPTPGDRHLIVSPGRLVWEKGHFDVLRALTALPHEVDALLVGAGPERERLLRYAADLGVSERVEIRAVGYDEMPAVFATASAVVLGSLSIPLWEEQFGMVLAEAMAAGVPIVASTSGAIPEVLDGSGAALFAPGDWIGLAESLAGGALTSAPGTRLVYPPELVRRYSVEAAAERLDAIYRRVLERG